MTTCFNTPCEREATTYYRDESNWAHHLCAICGDAFQLGQANADKYVYGIEDEPDEEESDMEVYDYGDGELFSTCQICGVTEESVQSCPGYGDRPLCSKCAAMHDEGEGDEDE